MVVSSSIIIILDELLVKLEFSYLSLEGIRFTVVSSSSL